MDLYQTENQYLTTLSQFWKKYVRFIMMAIVVVALGVAGFRYYRHQESVRRDQASMLFATMMVAYQQQDEAMVVHRGKVLHEQYKKVSPYPELASFLQSKVALDAGKSVEAIEHLNYVLEHYPHSTLIHIARTRLARLKHSLGETEEALALLSKPANGFTALYQEVKGDILVQSQRTDEAKLAYQKALETVPADFKTYIELKLKDIEHVQMQKKEDKE